LAVRGRARKSVRMKIVYSSSFIDQVRVLDKRTKKIIRKKLNLASENPFRFKSIKGYGRMFRIRIGDRRMIYLVDRRTIKILMLTDRKKGYQDLVSYIKNNQ